MAIASSQAYKGISRFVLSNGLVVITQPDSFLPIVCLRGSFRFGTATEAVEHGGRLKMLTSLFLSGTDTKDTVQIARLLDAMGSSISFNVHHDAVHFSLSSLSKHFFETFTVLTELIFRPSFPADEVERLRKVLLADLKKKADQPSLLAWEVFNHFVYGDHPYRRSVDGFEDSVRTISREDILAEYRKHVKPSQAIVAVAGDFQSAALMNLIGNSAWGQVVHQNQNALSIASPRSQGRRIFLVERDLTQSNICVGNLSSKRKSDDHYASSLMNYVLGGSGLVSRLTHAIRTERGLAYSVYSGITKRLHGGTFSVHMQTKNESTGDAIRLIESEMTRLRDQTVSDAEWNDARHFFKGSFPFRLETNSNVAFYLEQSEFYDLGLDYLDKETDEIMRLTPEDIRHAARRYLLIDHSTIVVVGNTDLLETQLESLGVATEVNYWALKEQS